MKLELSNGLISITDMEFSRISDLIYRFFGIHLADKKKALVCSRLHNVIKNLGFLTFSEYYDYIQNDKSGSGLLTLIDKISTNYSFFFRENDHFMFLKDKIIPELTAAQNKRRIENIKIWSAGCASGEEPYTLAMIVDDYFRMEKYKPDTGILATDISKTALEFAQIAVYNPESLKLLPEKYIDRYFIKQKDNKFAIRGELKRYILFKTLNLMRDNYPFKGKFHVVFLRNVMIYFDNEVRKQLIERMHRYIHNGGYLFLGHSESLGKGMGLFKYIKPAVYKKI